MSLFLHIIRSEGLSHLSYLIGQGNQAAVIDPRRDCREYVELAHSHGANITHVFETHRNEDYVIGSRNLVRMTGAKIFHGAVLDFEYGEPAKEGDIFEIGTLKIKALETPGHTFESLSYAVYDTSTGDEAVAVFTGDALFIGDVGRTDFFPGRETETAGLLHDSIHKKLLPLGDQAILYPAHGAGSVCGSGMAEREFSTIGYERKHNPALQIDREAFIRRKLAEVHYLPAYFKKMEEYNLRGNAPALDCIPLPPPMTPGQLDKTMKNGATVIDLRSAEAFAGAFIPDSLAIPMDMLQAYVGYFVDYETDIALVVDHKDEVQKAVTDLARLGYDRVVGFLAHSMMSWEVSGRQYDRIPAVHVEELVRRIEHKEDFVLLDVRQAYELEGGILPGATTIFLGDLPKRMNEIPRGKTITAFCGSGLRAIIAASLLKKAGYEHVENSMGSMAACMSFGCPLDEA